MPLCGARARETCMYNPLSLPKVCNIKDILYILYDLVQTKIQNGEIHATEIHSSNPQICTIGENCANFFFICYGTLIKYNGFPFGKILNIFNLSNGTNLIAA